MLPAILLTVLVAVQTPPAGQSPPPSEASLEAARQLLLIGLHAEAIAAYEALAKEHPGSAPVQIGLGRSLAAAAAARGDAEGSAGFQRAQAVLRRAVDLAASRSVRREAIDDLAELFVLWQPGRRDAGQAVFDDLVGRYPDEFDVHVGRAWIWFGDSTMDRLVAALTTVRDRFPGEAEAHWRLGMTLRDEANLTMTDPAQAPQRRARLDEALAAFDRALALDAESGMAMLYKALVLKDLAELESDATKAATLLAESSALFKRSEAILRRGSGG